mgnify:FL=1
MTKRNLTRGATMVEVSVAAVIGTMVLGTALTLFVAGAGMWVHGSEMVEAEGQSRQAIRVITDQLRQAMVVAVDANGQGATYRLPTRDASGIFSSPPVWDGVTRRIFHNSGSIVIQEGAASRTICRNVVLQDPDNGGANYRIFTTPPTAIFREVSVRVVTRRIAQGRTYLGRKRETVYLRNIPKLTQ